MNYEQFLESKHKSHTKSGFELKESYFELAKKNVASAVEAKAQLSLL